MMQKNQREQIAEKGAESLRSYANFRSFNSFGLHLIVYEEGTEIRDQNGSKSMHPEGIGKNINNETSSEPDQKQIHSADVGREDQNTGYINKAERVIEQDHIPHEKDLQKQVQQNHQRILYGLA
jgi:hypothetical protein